MISPRRIWPVFTASLLLLAGCTKAPSPAGDDAAALRFWNQLNQREDFGDVQAAVEAWARVDSSPNVQLARMVALCELAADGLKRRNQQLASLSMKDVDPVLTDYASKLAALNATRIKAIGDAEAAFVEVRNLSDPGRLGLDLFGSLLRHAQDKDPFPAKFREQLLEKAQSLGESIPKARAVAEKASATAALESEVEAAEVSVRAALHKNHAGDFPPASSYRQHGATPVAGKLTRRRLILDAMGQQVGDWTFDALEEIKSFEVTASKADSARISAVVKCMAVGKNSGHRYDLAFTMNYEKRGDAWVLVGLAPAQ